MEYLIINDRKYSLVKDFKNGYDESIVREKLNDFFYMYNYIVGDWSYGKLRLKGFCIKGNPNYRKTNDYSNVDTYIKENCANECRYFILENLDVTKPMDMSEI